MCGECKGAGTQAQAILPFIGGAPCLHQRIQLRTHELLHTSCTIATTDRHSSYEFEKRRMRERKTWDGKFQPIAKSLEVCIDELLAKCNAPLFKIARYASGRHRYLVDLSAYLLQTFHFFLSFPHGHHRRTYNDSGLRIFRKIFPASIDGRTHSGPSCHSHPFFARV